MFLLFLLLEWWCTAATTTKGGRGGNWELLLNNSGVVAMHMALTHRNTVLIFDQTSAGPPATACTAVVAVTDRSRRAGHTLLSTILHPTPSAPRPPHRHVTGGHGEGSRKIRYYRPCSDRRCGWEESNASLANERWYATNQVLPEKDRVFIVGGLKVFTYEFMPKSSSSESAFELPFLRQTRSRREGGGNLYPFVHLSTDGNLFIFANRDSILFNYRRNRVIKHFPTIPGDGGRNYPSTGSSVLLPLEYKDGFRKAEVMVCGGAAAGAFRAAKHHHYLKALSSCGRLVVTADNPKWAMEEMPGPRLMSDMVILPIEGHQPAYHPFLYKPKKKVGTRFSVLRSSRIARMYHSSAIVLPDGRILVAGSNPYKRYLFNSGARYPTELRVEAFTPHYMGKFYDEKRVSNVSIECNSRSNGIRYGEEFNVMFALARRSEEIGFHVYAPPFATHSISMSQRMLKLGYRELVREVGGTTHSAVVLAPPSPAVAPAGFYLLTVVNGGIPSKSEWVRFVHG
uniref:Aldehyde oxidase GLOX-like n=1 Tax=Ananas comosus var. bracteatus TaxID=296719 RepID=A0A6V7PUN6_ANACO|nr:unnamed protein product [Ananas comosus var. bracteatus]